MSGAPVEGQRIHWLPGARWVLLGGWLLAGAGVWWVSEEAAASARSEGQLAAQHAVQVREEKLSAAFRSALQGVRAAEALREAELLAAALGGESGGSLEALARAPEHLRWAQAVTEGVLREAVLGGDGGSVAPSESSLRRREGWSWPQAAVWIWWVGAGLMLLAGALGLRTRLLDPLQRVLVGTSEPASAVGPVQQTTGTTGRPLPPALRALHRRIDALAEERRGLQGRVDAETRALGAALEESRALNDRLARARVQLAERERLASLGTLAAGIAHEFHNVLGGLGTCLDDLEEDLDPGDLGAAETVAVMRRAILRGRGVVSGLRAFGSAEGGAVARISVAVLWRDQEAEWRQLAELGGVRVEHRLEDLEAFLGPTRPWGQILTNLVRNAVQHSPPGGTVRVHWQRGPERACALWVEDSGAGVPEELRPRLFEPFFTTRSEVGGSGLGLSVVHGLLRGLGGTITVEASEALGGAAFVVRWEEPEAAGAEG